MSRKTEDVEISNISNAKKILTSLAAGGIAGGLAKTAIAPLDRSKIFFQTNETRNYRFRYALRWLRHGYRTEGFLSLWRGNTATLARIVPYSAINFMSFEQYKKLLKVDHHDTPTIYRWVLEASSWLLFHIGFAFHIQVHRGKPRWVHGPDDDLSPGQSEGGDGCDKF